MFIYLGFDYRDINWIATWYHDEDSKKYLKSKISLRAADWYKEPNGKQLRKLLDLSELINCVFFIASVMKSLDINQNEWMLYHYCKSVELMEKTPFLLNILKDYKK